MNKFIFILVLSLLLCGCSNNNEKNNQYIKIEQVKEIMDEKDYKIIDVRTREEYEYNHLVDAINIPYNEINENLDISKDTIIFVYCKSGNRSSIAWQTLNNLGYTVYDLGAFDHIELPKE